MSDRKAKTPEEVNLAFDALKPSKGMVRLWTALGGRGAVPATYGDIRREIGVLERAAIDNGERKPWPPTKT